MIFNPKGAIIRLQLHQTILTTEPPAPAMVKYVVVRLIGDKRYLSKNLFQELFEKGVTLIIKIKKNMKNCLVERVDELMLMCRSPNF